MGGSQSQERVVNVEETVGEGGAQITVTEDFVKYLKDKQRKGEGGATTAEQSHDQEDESHEQEEEEEYEPEVPPFISAETVLSGEPSAESARRRYASDEAERWKAKYELERRKNNTMKQLSSKEFDETAKGIKEKLRSKIKEPVGLVCEDSKNMVYDCYHSNPGRSLNCTNETREFFECVERVRQTTLQASPAQ